MFFAILMGGIPNCALVVITTDINKSNVVIKLKNFFSFILLLKFCCLLMFLFSTFVTVDPELK